MVDKKIETEKYEGPDKLNTAFDRAISWGSVVYGLGQVFAFTGRNINLKVLNWGSAAVTIVAGVLGYRSAAKGEQQFNALKSERNEAAIRNGVLQAQVNSLKEEVSVHRKRFAEGITSRSADGSHASAADVDKLNVAAEAAR